MTATPQKKTFNQLYEELKKETEEERAMLEDPILFELLVYGRNPTTSNDAQGKNGNFISSPLLLYSKPCPTPSSSTS
jgi:hypothetical protein